MQILWLVLQGQESILQGQEMHDIRPSGNGKQVWETARRNMELDAIKISVCTNNIEGEQRCKTC